VATAILTGNVIPQALLAHTPLAGRELPAANAYHSAFIVSGVLALAAAVVPLMLRTRETAPPAGQAEPQAVEASPAALREPEFV